MAAEMRAGMFDVDKWRSVIRERRRRAPVIAMSEMTFQQYGKAAWYEYKKTKSEAEDYFKDLSIICPIKISKVDCGTIRLRDLKPKQIDKLTNELRERPERKK
jgi:hypothetical protein